MLNPVRFRVSRPKGREARAEGTEPIGEPGGWRPEAKPKGHAQILINQGSAVGRLHDNTGRIVAESVQKSRRKVFEKVGNGVFVHEV